MANDLRYDGKVAVVTGSGNGLGKSHALLLASRGAKVVVNDLGGSAHGEGKSSAAADVVVAEIKAAGGEAVANYDSVEDGDKIIQQAMDTWGRVDIVVNNAGILRDVSFAKLSQDDWDLIYRVHVLGAFKVTHAAWPHMREQQYGRIIMTASAAGIYGNFGQSNYSMAKLGVVGFAQTLALEGQKRNILTNSIAPIAGSRMTETVLPQNLIDALRPEYVTPLVAWLCHEDCDENGSLFEVGGGFFGKLRWERTQGKTFRVGRSIAVEDIKSSWKQLTTFDENATHPDSVTASMAPILTNVNAGESKGGNQFIDVDEALGFEFPTAKASYDERDMAIYSLGVGAAEDPTNNTDLQYVYESHGEGFRTLPTYGVVPAINMVLDFAKKGVTAPGMNYGLDRILHGEQYTELIRPLPRAATLKHKAKITDIYDKGKNALVITETKSFDEDDNLLIINRSTTVVRGAGGWGGDRGPTEEVNTPPERAPDTVTEQAIHPNQALLYRLSGDWNPLHADPNMATAFGFEKPILHGLCTFGYAGRHVIDAYAPDADPRFFKSIEVRFADTVFPGETLVTSMWKESDTRIVFECKVKERDKLVISRAAIELYAEIPAAAPKPVAAAKASANAADAPSSADVFVAIREYVAANPELSKSVGTVYQFKLDTPESVWTLDLKDGGVAEGETVKPQCTLSLSDADFMDMCSGKADPMKLYMDQKLKISGDLMASQKLDFLQKIDPQLVLDAAAARQGSGEAAPSKGGESVVEDVFIAIDAHIRANPDLVAGIGKVYQFAISAPESIWTLDLKEGFVVAGDEAKADCTLNLTQENFLKMTDGSADPMKLYMDGLLKIDGDLMASQKLGFLQEIDPEQAKKAVAEARAAGKSLGDSSTAEGGAASIAPQFFENLENLTQERPDLAASVGATVHLVIQEPDSEWTLDFKGGKNEISMGRNGESDALLTLTEETLAAWSKGESIQNLFQTGAIRADGDVRVLQGLGFFKGVI